jgi:hypothetical protein
MPAEQSNERVKRWPEQVELGRWKGCDQEPVLMVEPYDGADPDQWEQKTYVPADSPSVLSVEEARLLAKHCKTRNLACERILNRLSDFAEEADRG